MANPTIADLYTYRTTWDADEKEFCGTCVEFPLLSHFDKTPEAAQRGIRELVGFSLSILAEKHEKPPEPLSKKKFSGNFMIRTTPTLHRCLAAAALEENVSLNHLVVTRLEANLLRHVDLVTVLVEHLVRDDDHFSKVVKALGEARFETRPSKAVAASAYSEPGIKRVTKKAASSGKPRHRTA